MPEGTAAPSPAAAPANTESTPSTQTPAPAKGGNSAPVAAAQPEWNDETEKQFFELAKRAPWARTKHKGEEKPIDSREAFLEVVNKAQRVTGIEKVAEQTKKEREEAARLRAEAEQVLSLRERARRGDPDARRELFGESPDEAAQREAEWNKLTPEMRQLLVERQAMAEQLEEARKAQQTLLQEQQERTRQQQLEQRRTETMKFLDQLIPLLGVSPENAESLLGVTDEAVRSLKQEGFTLAELTPGLVRQRVAQIQEQLADGYFSKLPLEARLKLLGLEEAGDEQFEKYPDKWLTRAVRFKALKLDKQRRQPPQATAPAQERQGKTEEAPEVLQPWRWGRR